MLIYLLYDGNIFDKNLGTERNPVMIRENILNRKTNIGIELGSTRIKATLIDDSFTPIASGAFEWENKYENGYWTYSLESVHEGIKACFKSLADDVYAKYGVKPEKPSAIGISAMMHGYLAFDKDDNLLVPFRTWRNTTTCTAAEELTGLFGYNIPQRWSIAHLYQAILNGEEHVEKIAYITTLSGYIHYLLTGKRELGIGDASGMFPIKDNDYDAEMMTKFDALIADRKLPWKLRDILPSVKLAGDTSTVLSEEGARFLDPDGNLCAGTIICPPEGDGETGMTATNSVLPRTGNISAGTSVFAMLVMEKPLSKVYPEIDIVMTPDGHPVAMVHCNNCSSELDAWVNIFAEFASLTGINISKSEVYSLLYKNAMTSERSCTGLTAYNYLSGEHVTDVHSGRPMFFRTPDSKLNLASFMNTQLYSAFATLKIGMELLFDKEKVTADKFLAHGGLFKVEGVAQQILADALDTPVSVMETAGEGGSWGMALLAAYASSKTDKSLGEWLENEVFANMKVSTLSPSCEGVEGFNEYMKNYCKGLEAEKLLGKI